MIRLRSDRWYSADGQARSRRAIGARQSGTRRLISLCFLLALVVVLMQKAADPRYVSSAFRSLGVPLEPEAPGGKVADAESTESSAKSALGSSQSASRFEVSSDTDALARGDAKWAATCADLVPRLLEDAALQQVRLIGSLWFGISRRVPSSGGEVAADSFGQTGLESLELASLSRLDSLATALKPDEQDWSAQIKRFRQEWIVWWDALEELLAISTNVHGQSKGNGLVVGTRQSEVWSVIDPELNRAVSSYLDRRLIESLSDATPWKTDELLAFWRLLQRGQGKSARVEPLQEPVPTISTLQLEAEAGAWKGHTVRFRGSIRRLELVKRGNADVAPLRYWLAWLRGEDGSTQPVAVYSLVPEFGDLESGLMQQGSFPEIEIVAIVGKRLAYASQAGVQVAPTLFASELRVRRPRAGQTNPASPSGFSQEILLALVGGFLLAGTICYSIFRGKHPGVARHRRVRSGSGWHSAGLLLLASGAIDCTANCMAQEPALPPWAEASKPAELPELLVKRVRDLLSTSALDDLQKFRESPETGIPETSLRAMHVLNQLGWERAQDVAASLNTDDLPSRLWPVRMSGIVLAAEEITLTAKQRAWYQRHDDDALFVVHVEALRLDHLSAPASEQGSQGHRSLVPGAKAQERLAIVCQQIPRAWRRAVELRQPFQCSGLAIWESSSPKWIGVFANSVEWVFSTEDVADLAGASGLAHGSRFVPPIPDNLQLLARLGWNLRLADVVVGHTQQPLRDSESAAFYSLLRLLDSTTAAAAVAERADRLGPMEALREPQRTIGRAVRWPVRLVNCSIVPVEAAKERRLLGSDHYFQFDGFVDMGEQRVRYQFSAQAGDESVTGKEIVFEREFPVTIVMRATSEFTPPPRLAAREQSWPVGKFAEVEGCFYRLWAYESQLLQGASSTVRQAAPLVVASRLRLAPPPLRSPGGSEIGWFGYALCLATLVILAAILLSVAKTARI